MAIIFKFYKKNDLILQEFDTIWNTGTQTYEYVYFWVKAKIEISITFIILNLFLKSTIGREEDKLVIGVISQSF